MLGYTNEIWLLIQLPVATPPNALVFQGAGGDIAIPEMLKVMIFPNIMCLIVLLFFHLTYGTLIFQFGDYQYRSFNETINQIVAGGS